MNQFGLNADGWLGDKVGVMLKEPTVSVKATNIEKSWYVEQVEFGLTVRNVNRISTTQLEIQNWSLTNRKH